MKAKTGTGKIMSDQQAVGRLHYHRNQIKGALTRELELKR